MPGGNGIRRTKKGDGVGTARSEEKATWRRKHGSMREEMKRRNRIQDKKLKCGCTDMKSLPVCIWWKISVFSFFLIFCPLWLLRIVMHQVFVCVCVCVLCMYMCFLGISATT